MPKVKHPIKSREEVTPVVANILTRYLERKDTHNPNHTLRTSDTRWSHGLIQETNERFCLSLTRLLEREIRTIRATTPRSRSDPVFASKCDSHQTREASSRADISQSCLAHVSDIVPAALDTAGLHQGFVFGCNQELARKAEDVAAVSYPPNATNTPVQYSHSMVPEIQQMTSKAYASLADFVTHADAGSQPQVKIDAQQDVIGRLRLTHDSSSTSPRMMYYGPDVLEDILKDYDSPDPSVFDTAESRSEIYNGDEDILPLIDDYQPDQVLKSALNSHSDLFYDISCVNNKMASTDSRQSLSELLGDDQFLWDTWRRRASLQPSGEDDAELLHNMFVNDPDMKLSNSMVEDESCSDIMMFDSFDFSRQSTVSSQSSSHSVRSSAAPIQAERSESRSFLKQSSSGSGSKSSSPREAKEHARRPSLLRRLSHVKKMSEDDIEIQQRLTSRNVSIKSRKPHINHTRAS